MDIILGTTKVQMDALQAMISETQKLVSEIQGAIRKVETAAVSTAAAQNYVQQLTKLGYISNLEVKAPNHQENLAELRKVLSQFQTLEASLVAQRQGIESASKLVERAVTTIPTGGDHAKAAIEATVAQEVTKHRAMIDAARASVIKATA